MASRKMSAIVGFTVCFFLVFNAATNADDVTSTPNHSVTLLNTDKSLVGSTDTTKSPDLDVTDTTINNTSTATLNASDVSQFSPSTAAATTQSTVSVSGSSTSKAIETLTSLSSSTAPLTGPSASTNNQTYSTTKSDVTRGLSTSSPTQEIPIPQSNGTERTPNDTATTVLSDTEKHSMNYPEIILTSIFSTILVVVLLVIFSFGFKKCMRGRSQYSHHPLHETSYEADRYLPPDDTLVISGGLYDAPRIYNPNMTVLEEEESQNDYTSFSSRPGQFKLEFLPGDKDLDPALNRSQRRNV